FVVLYKKEFSEKEVNRIHSIVMEEIDNEYKSLVGGDGIEPDNNDMTLTSINTHSSNKYDKSLGKLLVKANKEAIEKRSKLNINNENSVNNNNNTIKSLSQVYTAKDINAILNSIYDMDFK